MAAQAKKKEIVFGPKPTKEQVDQRIVAYIQENFLDPSSASFACAEVTEKAWTRRSFIDPKRYGYLAFCKFTGKNAFGGYVGIKIYSFRFNGDDFEHIDNKDDMKLMEP